MIDMNKASFIKTTPRWSVSILIGSQGIMESAKKMLPGKKPPLISLELENIG